MSTDRWFVTADSLGALGEALFGDGSQADPVQTSTELQAEDLSDYMAFFDSVAEYMEFSSPIYHFSDEEEAAGDDDVTITSALITTQVYAAAVKANTEAGDLYQDPAFVWQQHYSDGSGAAQFSKVYSKQHGLSTGSVTNLVLTGGGLVDVFSASFNLSVLKVLSIHNDGDVAVTVSGNLGFAAPIPAGGCLHWAATDATGRAVTGSSADTLTITNGVGTGSVRVILLGS